MNEVVEEYNSLRSQFGALKRGIPKYLPMAFAEQGSAMLSSILNSDRAIEAKEPKRRYGKK
jgi:hypothetical protein